MKERAVKAYEVKEAEFPEAEQIRELERVVLLKVIDARWMDHIDDMDQLKTGYRTSVRMVREIRLLSIRCRVMTCSTT